MKIVLNRDVKNLGKVGEIVVVKNGYGRNFLLPKKYAVVATKTNIAQLEAKMQELKTKNQELSEKAKLIVELLDKVVLNMVRQASDDDTIYGSVRNKDIFNFINDLMKKNNINFDLDISGIKITDPIKSLGQYLVDVEIFGDIAGKIRLNICRAMADFENDVVAFDKKREKSLFNGKNVNEKLSSQPKQSVKEENVDLNSNFVKVNDKEQDEKQKSNNEEVDK